VILGRRFGELIERQLDLFESDYADLIAECEAADRAYGEASREAAEERYGAYLEVVASGSEALVEIRDGYAATLAEDAAEEYAEAFNHAVARRLPRFVPELEDN
jgi:hypothetical protein